eukprot:CCRYP_010311-RA/>CCRYP_010311-RA protein AED:0.46 eAED:0.46 QI:0/0/0/1/0/0/2/0/117
MLSSVNDVQDLHVGHSTMVFPKLEAQVECTLVVLDTNNGCQLNFCQPPRSPQIHVELLQMSLVTLHKAWEFKKGYHHHLVNFMNMTFQANIHHLWQLCLYSLSQKGLSKQKSFCCRW